MTKTTIRNLDESLYTQARVAAVEHKCSVAEIVNAALEDWLEAEEMVVSIPQPGQPKPK